MKKSNRVAGKNGDSTRPRAQSKATSRPAKAAPSNEALANASAVLKDPAPAGYRRLRSPALVSALKRFLSSESFATLSELDESYAASIEQQVAGALGAWVAFVQRERRRHDGYTVEFIANDLTEYCCVLDPDQFEYSISQARSRTLSPGQATLFRSLVERARELPLAQAAGYLKNLAGLIEHHPGLADEFKALNELCDAECQLGRSEAVKAHSKIGT